MLVHYRELFKKDFTGQYAIPAFNAHNLEFALAVVRAAVSKRAPVILQEASHSVQYAGLKNLYNIVASVANDPDVSVPVALHLDHTKDETIIEQAVDAGFSSVMIDASHLPFEENLAATQKAVPYAHAKGVWVQAELGRLRGNEDWVSVSDLESLFTDPDEAEEFVKESHVDALAIAVGTMHGIIKFRERIVPKLDIARIREIKQRVKIPLVLHGASGVPEDQIHEAIKAGISTINIDTELRMAFSQALRDFLASDEREVDPRKILTPAIAAVQKVAEEKFEEFGAAGQALVSSSR